MPKKTSSSRPSDAQKVILQQVLPKECNDEFLEYLQSQRDECPDQNQKFLEYLKTGLITLEYKHLVQALKKGYIELLKGIFDQLTIFEKTCLFSYNKVSPKKYNLLHYLADKSNLSLELQSNPEKISKIADLLLSNHVAINHLDSDGKTPLILAVQSANEALFLRLLKQPLLVASHFDYSEKNALDYALELANSKKDDHQEYLKFVNIYFVKLVQAGILILNRRIKDKLDEKLYQQQLDKIDLILDLLFDRRADLKIDEFNKLVLFKSIIENRNNSVIYEILCYDPCQLEYLERIFEQEYLEKLLENFNMYREKYYENFVSFKAYYEKNQVFFGIKRAFYENDPSIHSFEATKLIDTLKSNSSHNALFDYLNPLPGNVLKEISRRPEWVSCFEELFLKFYDPNYNVKKKNHLQNYLYWFLFFSFIEMRTPGADDKKISNDIATVISLVDFAFFNFFDTDKKGEFYHYFLRIYKYNNQLFVTKNNGVLVIPLLRINGKDREVDTHFMEQIKIKTSEINKKTGDLKLVSYCFLEDINGIEICELLYNIDEEYYGKTDLVDFEIRIDSSMVYNSSVGLASYRGEYHNGKFHGKGVLEFQLQLIKDLKIFIKNIKTNINQFKISEEEQIIVSKRNEKFEKLIEKPYLRYVGEFENGLFHGQGYLEMIDGSVYQGQFREGKFHGIGNVFIKKSQGLIHEYEAKFKEGKIFVETTKEGQKQKALTAVTKPDGLKSLADFRSNKTQVLAVKPDTKPDELKSKETEVLAVKPEEKSSQLKYKESLKVARFVGDAFANLYKLELKNKLENELRFLDLKKELSLLIRGLEFLELKLKENEDILEIRQSSRKSRRKEDEDSHLKLFTDEEDYLRTLDEKKQKILKENLTLISRIDQYRQHIKKLQEFIKTSQETLEEGLSLTHKKAEDDQVISSEKFSEVFDYHVIARRLKLSLDEKMIIDLSQHPLASQSDNDFLGDLVAFLNRENLVEKIKGGKPGMVDMDKLESKLKEIFKIDVNPELLIELSKFAQKLLLEVSAGISVLDDSDLDSYQYNFTPALSQPKPKPKTRPVERAQDERSAQAEGVQAEGAEVQYEAEQTEAEQQQSPSLPARYTSQQSSELWNLLCGIDLQIDIVQNPAISHRHNYVDLASFAMGCANIEDEELVDLETLESFQLKQIFHKELDNLVEEISKQYSYDHQQRNNLRSHIYIHNAYCIGGESLRDYLQKNYKKIFVQGRIVGELEGLGHARGASIDELKKSIWTIRKLTKIDDNSKTAVVKMEYPLSIQKFELSLQSKMTSKDQRAEKTYSGSLELEISRDEEFIYNLCQYFGQNPVAETQTELQEVKESLLDFLSSGLNEISAPQTSFKDLKKDFVDEAKQIKKSPNSQEILEKLLDSNFSILEFLAKETKVKLQELKETCEKKYSEINQHLQEVEVSKSRQGLRSTGASRVTGQGQSRS